MTRLRGFLIEIAIVAAVGVTLAALGPFGSFAMGDYGARLAYWLPGSFLAYAAFRPTFALAVAGAERLNFPETAGMFAAVVVGAIPASLLIAWWNGDRLAEVFDAGGWFQLYLQVAIIGALVALLFILIDKSAGRRPADSGQADVVEEVEIPFLKRLPADIARDLVALEMEDHYLRAHSPGRSTLVLMRMRDAEAELARAGGMRVHRSWWVARGAVDKAVRDGRNWRLRLTGGLEAPVARDRVAALRSAGWL